MGGGGGGGPLEPAIAPFAVRTLLERESWTENSFRDILAPWSMSSSTTGPWAANRVMVVSFMVMTKIVVVH